MKKLNRTDHVVKASISTLDTGNEMYRLLERLWPICRSITGQGVRETLSILRQTLPNLLLHAIPSATKCLDWTVPDEWNIRDAYIITPNGEKICDFKKNNLHVVGYSHPVNTALDLDQLQNHLYSLPNIPNAIPYITSYYKPHWGFCISQKERDRLTYGQYKVVIDSTIAPGMLDFADLYIRGESDEEVFLSTYICHPSMANNELSGPVVAAFLAKWLASMPLTHYSYRFSFVPETIGAIAYLSKNINHLRKSVKAGFMISCVGDDRAYGFMSSRATNTLSDRAAKHALKHHAGIFKSFSYLDRGSDERQYCSPGVDLPIASIFRSKYDTYPEYHTSLDNLTFVSPKGLLGGLNAFQRAIQVIEANDTYIAKIYGEPNLGSRGLYPTISTNDTLKIVSKITNIFSYSDGEHDLIDIAEMLNTPVWELSKIAGELESHSLIERTYR
jgi:aminopeptidase-like protein